MKKVKNKKEKKNIEYRRRNQKEGKDRIGTGGEKKKKKGGRGGEGGEEEVSQWRRR